jgi:hypothetical protein
MFGAFKDLSLLLHVTQYEGRTVEQLIAGHGSGGSEVGLGGAVVEASYVATDPQLLARLAEAHIPWIVDHQSVRFASPSFLEVARLRALPYAPLTALDSSRFTDATEAFVRGALEFQAQAEPSMYLVPSLPLSRPSAGTFRTFARIHTLAADLNGSFVPFRPLVAAAYPSADVVRGRFSVFEHLQDRSFAGVYVLPLQLNPKRDSVERLVSYAHFLEHGQELGLRVIAGRAGTFGLILAAVGVENFDSGLGERESFSLSRLSTVRQRNPDGRRKGGRQQRVYSPQLRSMLAWGDADSSLETIPLRAQLSCLLGACRSGGYRYALEHPREHFFHARMAELEELRDRRTTELRVQLVMDWLRTAADTARLVNRVRAEGGKQPLNFGHLDVWRAVLTRIAAAVAVREG